MEDGGLPAEVHIIIRPAVVGDAEGILITHRSAIQWICDTQSGPPGLAAWANQLAAERYISGIESDRFTVAEIEGDVCGFADFDRATAEITALYVRPEWHGRGIGRKLLQHVEDLARGDGLSRLRLKSSLSAQGFYERHGFISVKRDEHRLSNGTMVPCVWEEKVL